MNTLKNSGFILVTVLCTLIVISFLSIASFDYAQMMLKMTDSYWKTQQLKLLFLKNLSVVEAAFVQDSQKIPCTFDWHFPNYYADKTEEWLQGHACMIKSASRTFYYVIEIGRYKTCAELKAQQFYYVSVVRMTLVNFDSYSSHFLQSTYIMEKGRALICRDVSRIHELGRQGFRTR